MHAEILKADQPEARFGEKGYIAHLVMIRWSPLKQVGTLPIYRKNGIIIALDACKKPFVAL